MITGQMVKSISISKRAKWCALASFCMFLVGCSSSSSEDSKNISNSDRINSIMKETVLLDVAPEAPENVRHPEWGDAPEHVVAKRKPPTMNKSNLPVQNVESSRSSDNPVGSNMHQPELYDAVEAFLNQNNAGYDVISGEHMMFRLKKNIKFALGSDKVSSSSQEWLKSIAQFLASDQAQGVEVIIDGHADNRGAEKVNDSLSNKRAERVKSILTEGNRVKNAIYTRGYGDDAPICDNMTEAGRSCNRRVELTFILPN